MITATGVVVIIIFSLLSFSLEKYLIAKKRNLASNIANRMVRQIDRHLNENLFATYALAALIKNGKGNISGFDGLAKEYIAYQPEISSLQLAPNGVIRHIVPLKGNEKAIGLNLLSDDKHNMEARLALQTAKLTLAGPFELKQGGEAIIGRLPVFLDDSRSNFWGFTTALIKMEDFLKAVQLKNLSTEEFNYELWREHPNTGSHHTIARSQSALSADPVIASLDVPNGRWFLSVTPTSGWLNLPRILIEVAIALTLALFSCWLMNSYIKWQQTLISSEASYRGLYTSSPVMLHSVNADMKITSTNQRWLDTLGYTSDEVIGMETTTFMTDSSKRDAIENSLPNLLKTGSCTDTPYQLISKMGHILDVLMSATADRNKEGQITQILVVMQDITERKQLEKMKNEFVSTVSHELRTPLTSISGALGLINGGALGEMPAQARQMIEIAYKNSQRLTHLINDLLDMEKLIAGKIHFELKAQPLAPLIESALESVRAYGDMYKVTFKITKLDDAQVMVDAIRLQQVLTNFLSNAAKFSPSGSQVDISARRTEKYIRVEVTDRGAGIPAAFHNKIFQKFFQTDSSDTRQKGGTGLGLAISKEIIERMNGVISFESTEGQGSCFYFKLPIAQ